MALSIEEICKLLGRQALTKEPPLLIDPEDPDRELTLEEIEWLAMIYGRADEDAPAEE